MTKVKAFGPPDTEEYWKKRLSTGRTGVTGVHGRIVELVRKYVKPKSTVLDIGVGPGHIFESLQQKYTVYGVELSKKAVSQYTFDTKNIMVGDVTKKFPTFPAAKTYDCIIISMLLHWLEDPEEMLSEIHKHLKSNGLVIVGTPNIGYWRGRVRLLFTGKFPNVSASHKIFLNGKQWKSLVKQAGFEVIDFSTMNLGALNYFAPNLIGGKVFIVGKKK